MFKINGNTISKGDTKYVFDHRIKTVIPHKNCYVVLLSVPFDDAELRNVYCLNDKLEIIWRSEDIHENFPNDLEMTYVHIDVEDDVVIASNFYGASYYIDFDSGKFVGRS